MQTTVGWREWVALPDLDIPHIKAKIDTGALTSCLHASAIEVRGDTVTFEVQPLRKVPSVVLHCTAPVVDRRVIRDSGGHEEERPVIRARLRLGPFDDLTDITLTDRARMLFPMLIGRRTLAAAGITVDPAQSYALGRVRGAYRKKRDS